MKYKSRLSNLPGLVLYRHRGVADSRGEVNSDQDVSHGVCDSSGVFH